MISILIAAYNVEKFIMKCLTSICNQTVDNYEVIVVNDGSFDGTEKLVKEFIKSNSQKQIKLISQTNKGLLETRKIGMKYAEGDYILFLDGDDYLEDNALQVLNECISTQKDVYLFNSNIVDSCGNTQGIFCSCNRENDLSIKDLLLSNISPSIWSKLFKRSYMDKISVDLPKMLNYAEDLALSTYFFSENPSIEYINKTLHNYVQHESSMTKQFNIKVLDNIAAIKYVGLILKNKSIYVQYQEEFEYLAFCHLFYYRISSNYKCDDNFKKLYVEFRNTVKEPMDNKYIISKLNELSFFKKHIYKLAMYYLGVDRIVALLK